MNAIEVVQLSRRFGEFVAVDEVSFTVPRGEIFGYLGANGAGKSTTIRMLCGLLAPSGGKALVAGHDVATAPEAVKASIGYMSQRFSLYLDITARENLDFFAAAYGLPRAQARRRVDEVIAELELSGAVDELTAALPGGVQQRVALACAIVHQPEIVFLDEPTAGVDPTARREFWRLIRSLSRAGTTVFVTTHYMDEAEYCARIGLMVAGRLVALDTPAALKAQHAPGLVYDLSGGALRGLSEKLTALAGVKDVSPYGAGVHVRVDPAQVSEAQLLELARRHGVTQPAIAPSSPTLEDVFIEAARRG